MPKILTIEKISKKSHEQLIENGFEVKLASSIDEEIVKEEAKDVDAIIVHCTELNDNIISNAKNLKLISRHGTGINNIDLNSATKHNVLVSKVDGANHYSVAEYYISMIITLSRKFYIADNYFREGKFKEDDSTLPHLAMKYKLSGSEVTGKKLAILGYGLIGKELAKLAKMFNMEILIYHPTKKYEEFKTYNSLEKILVLADFVAICLPLNEKTKNLISKKELSYMKNTAYILNAARGGIINEEDLANFLNEDKIAGAAIDVFEIEPPKDSLILNAKNCILTPHIAGSTEEAMKKLSKGCIQNIIDFFIHKKLPKNTVNADKIKIKF